jgi:hypothetical protein
MTLLASCGDNNELMGMRSRMMRGRQVQEEGCIEEP